jgi:hypothetical protein
VATLALIGYLALAVDLLVSVVDDPVLGLVALVAVGVGVPLTWIGASRPRWRGRIAALAALGVVGGVAVLVAAGQSASELVVVVATIAITSAAGVWALAWEIRSTVARRWSSATRARHGVLLMNAKSGGGKVERFDLPAECAHRGIEPLLLAPGDDLRALVEDAVARGADVIGMAGGTVRKLSSLRSRLRTTSRLSVCPRARAIISRSISVSTATTSSDHATPTALHDRPASTWPTSTYGCSSTTFRSGSTRESWLRTNIATPSCERLPRCCRRCSDVLDSSAFPCSRRRGLGCRR